MPGPQWPYTKLDYENIIRHVFDEVNDRLRVDASVSVVMGEVECTISHIDDSIKIGDGVDLLAINPDGSINVNITAGSSIPKQVVNTYNEISAIASGSETVIATYTAPIGKDSFLTRIESAGDNIAQYRVFHNASVISKFYTNFGSDLSTNFDFTTNATDCPGFKIAVGDTIQIKALHSRPFTGNFNARIQIIEVG